MTCSFKYDMRNFVNFHATTQKFQNFTSMGYFCPKYMRFELKKILRSYLSWHWAAMKNLNKHWPCGFKSGIRNWVNLHYSAQKSEKLYIDELFLSKGYFQLENFQKIWPKILTPYFFYSNLYLTFLRSSCENIFKIVCIVSEKIGK